MKYLAGRERISGLPFLLGFGESNMAMSIREALRHVKKQLIPKINDALTHEVYEAATLAESDAIYGIVYSTVTSGKYRRRKDNGGLSDPEHMQMVGGKASNCRIEIRNNTPVNPFLNGVDASGGLSKNTGRLDVIVESGSGYDFASPGPRPFTQATIEGLRDNRGHIEAMKDGLIRQGLNVK